MKRFFNVVLTAMAMLVIFLLSAFIAMRLAIHGREVEVPNLAGLTLQEASSKAAHAWASASGSKTSSTPRMSHPVTSSDSSQRTGRNRSQRVGYPRHRKYRPAAGLDPRCHRTVRTAGLPHPPPLVS